MKKIAGPNPAIFNLFHREVAVFKSPASRFLPLSLCRKTYIVRRLSLVRLRIGPDF